MDSLPIAAINILENVTRSRSQSGCYAQLTPVEVYQLMILDAVDLVLIDVRTKVECDSVGFIPGSIHIEWSSYPDGVLNHQFLTILQNRVKRDQLVVFYCRAGFRSQFAAELATQAGYHLACNMEDGFEGAIDLKSNQRSHINGWKYSQLPWVQQ